MEFIGKYKISGEIGKGGMGAIYKAQHPTLKETVVVKKLTIQNKEMVERFRREAKIQMKIVHPSIVQVYDHFEEKGFHYIVMEYVDGITLEKLISQKKKLSNVAAMLIFSEVAKALAYAHQMGVIHRDIKPANILISKKGEVKFLDFGVASLIDDDDDGLTKAGMTIGTLSYIAPETISNAQLRDQRSDIYSAGVLLYEMVTGKKPFEGGFTPEMIQKVQKGNFIRPNKLNPNIKGVIQRVILKAMHKKISRRTPRLEKAIQKFAPYLRQFNDQEKINLGILDYINDKDDLEKKATTLAGALARSLWFWGVLVVLLGLGSGAAYLAFEKGLKYEYLYAEKYGSFQVELRVKKGFKDANQIFYRVQILKQVGKKWYSVDSSKTVIKHQPLGSKKNFWVFKSDKIYLEKGIYRILVDMEQEQFHTTFYLASLKGRKEITTSTSERVLVFQTKSTVASLPANISLKPLDLRTGRAITQGVKTKIYHKGDWLDWLEFQKRPDAKELIRSNKNYSFKVSADHYYPMNLNFKIQLEQTQLTLEPSMIAKPVSLRLNTDLKDLEILLDNKTSYLKAGKTPKVLVLPTLGKSTKFQLFPGLYYLTLIYNQGWGQNTSQTQEITLTPTKALSLKVSLSKDGKTLKITPKD